MNIFLMLMIDEAVLRRMAGGCKWDLLASRLNRTPEGSGS